MILEEAVAICQGQRGVGVVLLIEERVRRREAHREGEVRATARVDGIIHGIAVDAQLEVEVIRRTLMVVLEGVVRPVVEAVVSEVERGGELEPIVGPVQTTPIGNAQTDDAKRLIRVVGIFVERTCPLLVIAAITTIASSITSVAIATVIGIIVARAVVVTRLPRVIALVDGRHTGVESTYRKEVGSLTTKPRIAEGDAELVVIACVRLPVDGELLPIALRDDPLVHTGAEEILYGEVREGKADRADNTRLTPADGEVQLVVALRREVVLNIYRSALWVGDGLRYGLLRIEVAELVEDTEGVH